MEQLIELARRLGKQVALNERVVLLKKAQQIVNDDDYARELILEFQKQVEKIRQLEQEQKPVEVDDKHKLQEIEQKISIHEPLKELSRRQADYLELMRKINQAIHEELKIEL